MSQIRLWICQSPRNFSPSFGLDKSPWKPPHLSIASTGFSLLTAQLCKDHSAHKYWTMLREKFYSVFTFPAKNDKINQAFQVLKTRLPLSCYILVHNTFRSQCILGLRDALSLMAKTVCLLWSDISLKYPKFVNLWYIGMPWKSYFRRKLNESWKCVSIFYVKQDQNTFICW